jgi:hypothetical protein
MATTRAKTSNGGLLSLKADEAMSRFRIVTEGSDADHVKYPDAVDVRPVGILADGADAAEDLVSVQVFGKGETKVVKLNLTCAKGDKLVAEDPSTDAAGKARALPTAAGAYWVIGTALEAGADEQEVAFEDCEPYRVVVQAHVVDVAAVTQDALTDSTTGVAATTLAAQAAVTTHAITDSTTGAVSTTALAAVTASANAGSADVGPVKDGLATLAAEAALTKADLATCRTEVKTYVASLAAQLAKVKTDNAAQVTKINALIAALETAGVLKAS